MRILDINNSELKYKEIDFSKGYLKDDKIFIKHHKEQKEVQQQSHYEVIREYENGGRDLKEVVDIPYQPFKEAWDEYEDIQRYILYTEEELAKIETEKQAQKDEITLLKERIAELEKVINKLK